MGFPYPEMLKKPLFFLSSVLFFAVACCVQGDTGVKGRWQGCFFFFGSPLIAQNLVEAVASSVTVYLRQEIRGMSCETCDDGFLLLIVHVGGGALRSCDEVCLLMLSWYVCNKQSTVG